MITTAVAFAPVPHRAHKGRSIIMRASAYWIERKQFGLFPPRARRECLSTTLLSSTAHLQGDGHTRLPQELTAHHHGSTRVVWNMDTLDWLDGRVQLDMPVRYNIITSIPDISELGTRRQRVDAEDYEDWFIEVVSKIMNVLPPDNVAIFYQTPGRSSGIGGAWLDKGHLCQLGARSAGARCVWQKIALDGPPGIERAGRPGFVNMLCFSKQHALPSSADGAARFKTVDVLYRGSMSYRKAMGEEACREAVSYCERWVDGKFSSQRAVVDPFCGHGSVLAAANCSGASAYGLDLSAECCRLALSYPFKPRGKS